MLLRLAALLIPLLVVGCGPAAAQGDAPVVIYRCGSTFTNSAAEAEAKKCKPLASRKVPDAEEDERKARKEACLRRAALAPTEAGVKVGVQSCNREFGP